MLRDSGNICPRGSLIIRNEIETPSRLYLFLEHFEAYSELKSLVFRDNFIPMMHQCFYFTFFHIIIILKSNISSHFPRFLGQRNPLWYAESSKSLLIG